MGRNGDPYLDNLFLLSIRRCKSRSPHRIEIRASINFQQNVIKEKNIFPTPGIEPGPRR